jgi:hypothetical protein
MALLNSGSSNLLSSTRSKPATAIIASQTDERIRTRDYESADHKSVAMYTPTYLTRRMRMNVAAAVLTRVIVLFAVSDGLQEKS